MTKKDYYDILGVGKGATVDEIKRVYRQLAMKHHPDRVSAEHKKEAEEKFKEISEAYAVLSDPQKRQVYDQYGHAGFDQRYSTEDIFRNADFSSIFESMGGGGGASAFEDLLGGLFGFGGGGGGARSRNGRGGDLEYELVLSFEDAARGARKTITVPRREVCHACRGEGGTRATCSTCQGSGQIRQSAGFMVIARTCPKCQGQGGTLTKACSTCKGSGRTSAQRQIEVSVPAGIESGMRLRVSGEGEGGTRQRGDLYVLIHVEPHLVFHRDGPNLLLEYPVPLSQATLGAEVDVPTLTGRVTMKIPAGTQSGAVFRVRGKGIPDVHTGRAGDLLVRVVVETPVNLSAKQRQLLEELNKAFGDESYPARRSLLSKLKGH
ncbi:MAG: molecular chaperone DnaJ [Candidatus Omnitrophica bacterium]|nr:molecular chaperone DnaJ [Candidatus Omnitrophota bacterium]